MVFLVSFQQKKAHHHFYSSTMKRLITLLAAFLLAYNVGAQSSYRNEWIDYSKTYHKFKVFLGIDNLGYPIKKGLVRIYQPALSVAGLASTPAEHFQLWKDGTEVSIYTSLSTGILSATDYIEFWGEMNDGKLDNDLYRDPEFQLSDVWSLQTDTAAYFLTVNSASANKRLEATANNVLGNSLPATEYFMSSVSFTHRLK
jgi:hypothetical protein